MNYELLKNEFKKIKKEELVYIDDIAKISTNKMLSESEKLTMYRNLNNYDIKLNKLIKLLRNEIIKNKSLTPTNLDDIIIEFNIDKDYLSAINFNYLSLKKLILKSLGIDIKTSKYQLSIFNIIRNYQGYKEIDIDIILNNQKLIDYPIYIFTGYYDYSEDCYGPCLKKTNDYVYGIYKNISNNPNEKIEISKNNIPNFEKTNIIIHSKKHVDSIEIDKIFKEELLSIQNNSINECIIKTKIRVEELNYLRNPEYQEKHFLERVNELYKQVKGKFIKQEILYNGKFLDILRETYQLPNGNTIEKEKVIKNHGKNSVIIIAITPDNQYLITFQNRINNKLIAEFPSGYIEPNETPLEAAKRELQEETGYVTDELLIIDEAYTSPGIDNSLTYIVIANNCNKTNKIKTNSTELVNYGLFSESELNYLINKNIMNGSMNKLAYYNLINKRNITYKKVKRLKITN